MNVFLIETDPITADSVALFLERDGFHVTSFFNPAEAIAAAAERQPDVVITEIILSGMNGLRLCAQLKEQDTTSSIAVLVLSVLQAEDRAIAAGADGFLLKPVDKKTLATAVRHVFRVRGRGN